MRENVKREDGALPPGWVWATIGEIAESINPGFPSGQHNREGRGVPHLRPMNISAKGEIELSRVEYVEVADYDPLMQGDVLFNNTNSPALVGKTTHIRRDTNWAYSNHMTRLRLHKGQVDAGWVAHSLHYLFLEGFFRMNCRHHVNQASISSEFLAEYVSIPLPPLPEQHRIVAVIEELFSDLDAGVASLKRVQANLKRYRASVLKAACEGRLVPTEAELARVDVGAGSPRPYEPADVLLQRILAERRARWEAEHPGKKYVEPAAPKTDGLPELPEGWCWAKVNQAGRVQLGRQRAPQYHTGPHMRPYLRVANVFEDHIDVSDVLEMNFDPLEFAQYRLEPGDILLNEGQSPELLGRPAMYRGEVPGACFQNTLIRFQAREGVLPAFALCVFRAYMHSGRFRRISQITTNIAHLSVGRFSEVEFPLPPLPEQRRIVAEVERRLSVVAELEATAAANLARAGRLRQAVLKRAFKGQLVR